MGAKRSAQLGIRISEQNKAWLERAREAWGLRSVSDVVNRLIEKAMSAPPGSEEAADNALLWPAYARSLEQRLESVEVALRAYMGKGAMLNPGRVAEGPAELSAEEMESLARLKRERPETWQAFLHTMSKGDAGSAGGSGSRGGRSRSKRGSG